MELVGKHVVVTGGGRGIGAALCRRFAAEGAAQVVVCDIDGDAAAGVADEIGGTFVAADVSTPDGNRYLITSSEEAYGPIDLFCANAGVAVGGGVDAPDDQWTRAWEVNLMAHVWAARQLVPRMLARGEGYILQTASAAGLLNNIGAAPYAVTKHGVVALAEWLSITYGDQGLKVSCLCPQAVNTRMLFPDPDEDTIGARGLDSVRRQGIIEPEDVAHAVVEGLADERFLILPHPEVRDFYTRKATDTDRWLRGMRRLQAASGDA